MTVVEKILALHSGQAEVKPGEIIDVQIDVRAARDFGGANVVNHLKEHGLTLDNPAQSCFTFDCNPTGSDQKYAANQHFCRLYAREQGVAVYDIDRGIGTHLMMDEGLVVPGSTAVSTDSHANILGAIGAFGQGMGDMDIAVAWSKGKVWFKVPPSVKITLTGEPATGLSAKDLVLNLLSVFGANDLLGYSVELEGHAIDRLSLDERITVASMATEMGAIILFITPGKEVLEYCKKRSGKDVQAVLADKDATYEKTIVLNAAAFTHKVSKPGKPDDTADLEEVKHRKIDSGFIGSCTNGRLEDMRVAAAILKNRRVAPGVVLKIVPSTSEVYNTCLDEGLLEIFRSAGALISNPGCAGCAAGQVGQNGPGEVTISTGNRNFPGKQGKGEVYLASPAVVAASCVAGYITSPDDIPETPALFKAVPSEKLHTTHRELEKSEKNMVLKGRAWFIPRDDVDTDMIFHNRHLTITDVREMGQHAFGNLKGYEDFAKKAQPGDIVVVGKNFGAGSSRQQAVDCFLSLGIQGILAESFGAIYERNAINAGFPIISCPALKNLQLEDGDVLEIDLLTGLIKNISKKTEVSGMKFSQVQRDIYLNGGIF
ncbi:MAG: aconitase/3-isopropylmalate dehydratase large subunit family protein [Bacteroidales bacterium]